MIGLVRRPLFALSLLVFPPLFLLQNAVPFVRVMLFLTMLYMVIAGGGLAWALEAVTGRLAEPRRFIIAAISVLALTGALSGIWLRSETPPHNDEIYRFPEAEKIIELMGPVLSDRAPVLTDVPLDNPLIYYGLEHGVPRMAMLSQGMVTSRFDSLWVVEDVRITKCRLDEIIKANGLDTLYFSPPVLVTALSDSRIFLFRPE
jgi:hypothetical protein